MWATITERSRASAINDSNAFSCCETVQIIAFMKRHTLLAWTTLLRES